MGTSQHTHGQPSYLPSDCPDNKEALDKLAAEAEQLNLDAPQIIESYSDWRRRAQLMSVWSQQTWTKVKPPLPPPLPAGVPFKS